MDREVQKFGKVHLENLCDFHHWSYTTAHGGRIPFGKEVMRGTPLHVTPEATEQFLVMPGTTYFQFQAFDFAESIPNPRIEILWIVEPHLLGSFESIVSLLHQLSVLLLPYLIDHFVEIFAHVKAIMNQQGVWQVCSSTAHVALRHI